MSLHFSVISYVNKYWTYVDKIVIIINIQLLVSDNKIYGSTQNPQGGTEDQDDENVGDLNDSDRSGKYEWLWPTTPDLPEEFQVTCQVCDVCLITYIFIA